MRTLSLSTLMFFALAIVARGQERNPFLDNPNSSVVLSTLNTIDRALSSGLTDGRTAVPQLVELLDRDDVALAARAAKTLGTVGTKLKPRRDDATVKVKLEAGTGLVRAADNAAKGRETVRDAAKKAVDSFTTEAERTEIRKQIQAAKKEKKE